MISFLHYTGYLILNLKHPFWTVGLSLTNGIVSSKIYNKLNDFNFEIDNFTFLDGDVPFFPSYGVCILQLIRFARACSNVSAFITIDTNFDCTTIQGIDTGR